eukprot:SAG22_NODE_374_length_11548_cov_6.893615_8_plen_431_part_00
MRGPAMARRARATASLIATVALLLVARQQQVDSCTTVDLMDDGKFQGVGPAIVAAGTVGRRSVVSLTECPCEAAMGARLSVGEAGTSKVLYEQLLPAQTRSGWYQGTFFVWISADYDGPATIGTASLLDAGGATITSKAVPRGGATNAWTQYDVVFSDPERVGAAYRLQLGGAFSAGQVTVGQISLIYSLPAEMPNLAISIGPVGSDGYTSIAALTDGDFVESNSWFIAVPDPDSTISFTLDFQDSTTEICGFIMYWPTDNFAGQWKIFYGNAGAASPSSKWIRATTDRTRDGDDASFLYDVDVDAGVTVPHVAACRTAGAVKVELSEPNSCCFRLLEFAVLGSGNPCLSECRNGGATPPDDSGAPCVCCAETDYFGQLVEQSPCGWRGRTCSQFYCEEECKNSGECIGPNTCRCPDGYTRCVLPGARGP